VGGQRGIGRSQFLALVLALGALVITAAVSVRDGMAASGKAGTVPQALVGCWHRHVGPLPVGTSAGVWLVGITRAGRLAAYTPGSTKCDSSSDFTATVSVVGKHLTVGPVPVCTTKGVYTWKASRTTLTLQATADKSCAPRALLFTGVWKRK
jgi:hypothetical protein